MTDRWHAYVGAVVRLERQLEIGLITQAEHDRQKAQLRAEYNNRRSTVPAR